MRRLLLSSNRSVFYSLIQELHFIDAFSRRWFNIKCSKQWKPIIYGLRWASGNIKTFLAFGNSSSLKKSIKLALEQCIEPLKCILWGIDWPKQWFGYLEFSNRITYFSPASQSSAVQYDPSNYVGIDFRYLINSIETLHNQSTTSCTIFAQKK